MQTDPSLQPHGPNAQQFVAGAELQLPAPVEAVMQTPAQSLGLEDQAFNVQRTSGAVETGWKVEGFIAGQDGSQKVAISK